MKNSNSLLKSCDFKNNIMDYLWISILGIAIVAFTTFIGRIVGIDYIFLDGGETLLPIVLTVAALVSGVRYAVNILGLAYKKEAADFAYSLPISKTGYYLSKLLSVTIQVFVTLCTIGLISGIFIIQSPFFVMQDIIIAIFGAMVTGMLFIGAIFLSISVTGKGGATFLFFAGIVYFPMVFAFTCNMYAVSAVRLGKVSMLTVPNLYTLTNTIYLQLKGNIVYYGMFRAWIFTLGLGLTYAGIGLYMFRKRDAETTENYTINKWVNYICMAVLPFVIIYTTASNLVSNYYEPSNYFEPIIAIGIFAAALLITYLYEIITHGKLRHKNRCFWVFLVLMIFSILTTNAIFESTYYGEKTTVDKEDVSHINLVFEKISPFCNSMYSEHITYGSFMAERVDITDVKIIADIDKVYKESNGRMKMPSYYAPLVKLHMNNGKTQYTFLQRDELFDNEVPTAYYGEELLTAFYQVPPIDAINNVMLHGMKLDNDQIEYIYLTYLEEYNNLTLEEKLYHSNKVFEQPPIEGAIFPFVSMDVFGKVGLYTTTDWLSITSKTPETAKKAFELFNNKYGDAAVEWINNSNAPEFVFISFFKNGEFVRWNNRNKDELYDYIFRIVSNYDMGAPDAGDNFAVLTYWSNKNYMNSYGRIYVKLSDEEFEKLSEYFVDEQ